MQTYDISMAPQFRKLLDERVAELTNDLRHEVAAAEAADGREVTDFKQVAGEETSAALDEAQAAHAARELEQVFAARDRLNGATYGYCLDCGEAIDLRRLTALPGTPYCTACQAIHENKRAAAHH